MARKKERGVFPKSHKGSVRGFMLADVVDAAIANIELHVKEHSNDDNELLTEWAIPQLKSVIERLRK